MQKQSVTIDLPNDIYNRYKVRAEQSKRSVEAEIIEAVAKAAPDGDKLSDELEELIVQLGFLDNVAVRRVARGKLSKKEATRIEALHYKRQDEGLDEQETRELASLMKKLDRVFVLRNEAISLLFERGQDISEFAPKQ